MTPIRDVIVEALIAEARGLLRDHDEERLLDDWQALLITRLADALEAEHEDLARANDALALKLDRHVAALERVAGLTTEPRR